MISVGGNSSSNGIQFSSSKYNVYFKSNNNKSKIFLRENKGLSKKSKNKFLLFISNLPIIRGIVEIFGISKVFLVSYIFLLLSDILSSNIIREAEAGESLNTVVIIISLCLSIAMMLFSLLVVFKTFKNFKTVFQYHAAEHKVIYTYNSNQTITLENCSLSPRVNDSCGTMLVCFILIVYIFFNILTNVLNINFGVSTTLLLTIGISYELFRLKPHLPVIRLIYKLGGFLQKYMFTREPTTIQLKQAMDAFNILLKAETNKYTEEEINTLITNGKEIQY